MFISVFLLLFVFPTYIFSTRPLHEYEPPASLIVGKDLTIIWENSKHAPRIVDWEDYDGGPENRGPYFIKKAQKSITIPRKAFYRIPNKLLLIPVDDKLEPKVVDVSFDQESLNVTFDKIEKNKIWFWGITPKNPCFSARRFSVGVRVINRKSIYKRLSGLFVWDLELKPDDKYEFAFYFTPDHEDAVKSVTAKGFSHANDISRALCHAHHGGTCHFTMQTYPKAWGRLHQIKFIRDIKFGIYKCPI